MTLKEYEIPQNRASVNIPELVVADTWLRARLPRLQDEFYACLTKFGFDVDGLRKA